MNIDLDKVLQGCERFRTLRFKPKLGWQVSFMDKCGCCAKVTAYCPSPTTALRATAKAMGNQKLVEMLTDWDRWHELLDIKAERELTHSEETERQEFARIVGRLDAEEGKAADVALGNLVKEHERVIASIQRLTAAVRAAAEGKPTGNEMLTPKTEECLACGYPHKVELGPVATCWQLCTKCGRRMPYRSAAPSPPPKHTWISRDGDPPEDAPTLTASPPQGP